jgi:lipopolysaccharide transport system permease protein
MLIEHEIEKTTDHPVRFADHAAVQPHRQRTLDNLAHTSALSFLSGAWERRRLVGVFLARDIRVRYRQTMLRGAWALLQPLLSISAFTFVFGHVAKVPSEGVPYPVFVFCGLLPWQLFARGLVRSANCLVEERYLLTRVYVPRLIPLLTAVLSGVVDFGAGLIVLVALMICYGARPSLAILWVGPLLMLALVTTAGCGLLLSAWNVKYRDVGYILPFFIQLYLLITPVAYPSSLVPAAWRFLYGLNPMATVVEGFRYALAGAAATNEGTVLAPLLISGISLLLGLICFLRMDREFADVV